MLTFEVAIERTWKRERQNMGKCLMGGQINELSSTSEFMTKVSKKSDRARIEMSSL